MGGKRRTWVRVPRAIVATCAIAAFGLTWMHWGSPPARASDPPQVDERRVLMIVHPAVVDTFLNGGRSQNGGPETTGGQWSVRCLHRFLANNLSDRDAFYATFFEQWLTTQIADNGAEIPPRDAALVKQLVLDQFSTVDSSGKRIFQMWKLPFELIAIAYRPDLRAADGSDAGELRFVYKLIGPDGEDLKFTLNM